MPACHHHSTTILYTRKARQGRRSGTSKVAASAQIKKVNHWQERLLDALILRPEVRLGDLAREFGVTQAWLSTVKNSDAFRDAFRRRNAEHSGALLSDVRAKTLGAAEMAVDAISKRLEETADIIPLPILLETADTMLKRSGFGESRQAPTPNVQVNLGVVTQADLTAAREKMREVKIEVPLPQLTTLPKAGSGGQDDSKVTFSRQAVEAEIQGTSTEKSESPGS